MADQREKTVDLSIRNAIGDLAIVAATIDRVGQETNMPAKALMQLQVALDEILSNIVKYAWPAGGNHEFQVHITARPDEMKVVIVDDGAAFDPRRHVPRKSPPRGVRPEPGGVGIQMTQQLIDGFDYARLDGQNRVTLIKKYAL